jgi:hypothetical protein
MLPIILVAVGAYLIGDSVLDKKGESKDSQNKEDEYLVTFIDKGGKHNDKIIKAKSESEAIEKAEKIMGYKSSKEFKPTKLAHGGKTQGYDDKEDERLAMEHGKMSKKDLDSTHARRDDAEFEERGKMADGGSIAENTTVEVGEDKISVIKNRKEKTGFAVYVQAKGYAPMTLDVYANKEAATKKAKALAKKNGYKFVG